MKSDVSMEQSRSSSIAKACDACRWRKLKCSKTTPGLVGNDNPDARCTRCIKSGLRCTFNDEHGRRGPKTGKRLNALRASQKAEALRSKVEIPQVEQLISAPDSDSSLEMSPMIDGEVPAGYLSPPGPESGFPAAESFHEHERPASTFAVEEVNGPPFVHEIQPWSPPINNFLFSNEDLFQQIDLFFRTAYPTYPVVHFDTVINKITRNLHLSDPDFREFLLSLVTINEACKFRRTPEHGTATMDILVRSIEASRSNSHGHHFSDSPSIDTIIVSLNLFIAHSVCNRHNRAFCYLTEAIGLFDLVPESEDPTERVRLTRVEYILFITESASVSIYGCQRKRLISRRPSNLPATAEPLLWYTNETLTEGALRNHFDFDLEQLDKRAVELLIRMTRLHLATEATEVASVTLDDLLLTTVAQGFQGINDIDALIYDTQTADVAITRQWKLAEFWLMGTSARVIPLSSATAVKGTIEMIATTALTWSKTIPPNNLRIVGLGKLANLTEAILKISSELGFAGGCNHLIRELMHTVAGPDYERQFAPQLSMTELFIGNIPRTIMSSEELDQFINNCQAG